MEKEPNFVLESDLSCLLQQVQSLRNQMIHQFSSIIFEIQQIQSGQRNRRTDKNSFKSEPKQHQPETDTSKNQLEPLPRMFVRSDSFLSSSPLLAESNLLEEEQPHTQTVVSGQVIEEEEEDDSEEEEVVAPASTAQDKKIGTPYAHARLQKMLSTRVMIEKDSGSMSGLQRVVKKVQFQTSSRVTQDNSSGEKVSPRVESKLPNRGRRSSEISICSNAEKEFEQGVKDLATERTLAQMIQGAKASKYVISCDSRFMTNWNIIMAITAVYMILLVPLDLAFDLNLAPITVVEVILELFCIADIVLRFHVSYICPATKEEVISKAEIQRHYLTHDFKWDVTSSVPFTLILLPFRGGTSKFFNITKFIRILKITRLLKARSTLKEIEKVSANPAWPRLLKIFLIFFGSCHYMGCISVYVTCNVAVFRDTETYVQRCEPYTSITEIFTAGYLYAVKMMVGEATGGGSLVEMQTELTYLIVGMAVTSTLIGGLASLLGSLDATLAAKNAEMDNVKEYLTRMKVTPSLQKKITRYYEFIWDIGQSTYNKRVLKGLPARLSFELTLDFKRNLIKQSPLFRMFKGKYVLKLVENMRSIVIFPDELVIEQGEQVKDLFLVARGTFSIFHFNPVTKSSIYIQTVHPGSHLGDYELLGLREASEVSVVAESFGELQMIDGRIFLNVLKSSPRLEKRFIQLATKACKEQEDKISLRKGSAKNVINMKHNTSEHVAVSLHSLLKYMENQEKAKATSPGNSNQSNYVSSPVDEQKKEEVKDPHVNSCIQQVMAAFSHQSVHSICNHDINMAQYKD